MADPPVTRASGGQRRSAGQGAGGKQFLGLPAWMWAVGGVAVVAGYLYIKSKSSSQQPSGQGTGGGRGGSGGGGAPTGWSSASFMSWIQDHQGTPPKPHPKPKKDPDPGKGKGDGHGK